MEEQSADGESTYWNVRTTTSNSITFYGFDASALRISYEPDIYHIDRAPKLDITEEDLPDEDF